VCGALAGPGAGPDTAAESLAELVRRAGWSDRLMAYGLRPATLDEYAEAGARAAHPVALEARRVAAALQDRL
jgi:hypothetical protein